ncbi:dynein heavy chain 1, cytosolic [Phakopsora pachyrhizi]|nr:dynein heavy chain 1, cytosolic [Phakopsora pachyrhizi]
MFCCDKMFSFRAMGLISVGLCQVGAWGCFEEANHLERRNFISISWQIQSTQPGLRAASVDSKADFKLFGKTMDQSTHWLCSQKFITAKTFGSKGVPFFSLCSKKFSRQPHYIFGLRYLKVALIYTGHLMRAQIKFGENSRAIFASDNQVEQEFLFQSVTETIVPKLVAEDVPCLNRSVLCCIKLHLL